MQVDGGPGGNMVPPPPPAGLHPAQMRATIAAQPASQRRVLVWLPRPARRLVRAAADALAHIETERLVIRAPTPADVPGLSQTIDSVVVAANGMTPQYIAEVLAQVSRPRTDLLGKLAVRSVITSRTTGEVVGEIGHQWIDLAHRSGEIGWWIGPAARRRGYAAEAVAAVLPALHAVGLARIWIGTAPDNVAVRRIVARIGARLVDEGVIPLPDGSTSPSMWFAHDG